MRVLVLGAGNIGSVIIYDLSIFIDIDELFVADRDVVQIESCIGLAGGSKAEALRLDVNEYSDLVGAMKRFDLVVNALPGKFGYRVVKAAIDAKVDLVDVSYMPEDVFQLRGEVDKAGIKVIPDAGVAPGLSNILVGHAVSMLDNVDAIHIYVGGFPTKPVPPLGYVVTWSVEDLIDEYMRSPRIVVDGRVVVADALSGLEEIVFPGIGVLEAFYTDGLRTLLHTIKGVRSMWEKTLRYPGHVEKIRLLMDLGLFSDIPVGGVSPRKLLIKLLSEKLVRRDVEDLLAMRVDIAGFAGGERTTYTYMLLERGFDEHGFSSMARVTGYTASTVAYLIFEDLIDISGIIPPEIIGMNRELYKLVVDRLNSKGIGIKAVVGRGN